MPRNRAGTKRQQILDAARILFTSQGFGSTSMDAVAAEANVSKATLYAYFTSKEELFGQVVASDRERYVHIPDTQEMNADIALVLNRLALELSGLILSTETVAIYRMIMSETQPNAALGAQFYHAGPALLLARIADCLEAAMKRGELRQAPTRTAAGQFIALILGELQLRALLQVGRVAGARTRAVVAREGVAVFLRAYAP